MGRIRTAGSGQGRWVAAGLLMLAAMAGLFVWRFAGSLSGAALSAYVTQQPGASLRTSLLGSGGAGSSGDDSSSGSSSSSRPKLKAKAGGPAARLQRLDYPPIAKPDRKVVEARCGATLGDWCGRYYAQEPIPAVPPPAANKTCLWGCNFVGVCDAAAGWCRCPAGWKGDDCSTRMRRPCSQHHRPFGFEPYDGPVDPAQGGTTHACADLCDDDVGHCWCNSTFPYGRIPADPHEPPGTPPQRIGRPLCHLCKRDTDFAGNKGHFGVTPTAALYGEKGWCQAEQPEFHCPCLLDGFGGPTCETYYEPFCPNQCNGHGECYMGFCKCHEGWFGTDCAQRRAGVPWTPGMEDGDRPWLKPHVHTPAARDPEPGATVKRPLIYVYELPAIYNSILLQYRVDKGCCTHRLFNEQNSTYYVDNWVYQPETGLHEMLLQSEHRTLDPEAADYFYIPAYSSCLIWPIVFANDFPFFHGGPVAGRTHAAVNMLMEVQSYIATHFPYWNRNGGRDHIVLQTHDEGSCWLPAVLRPAIVLSHWGRLEVPETADTGYYPADDYKAEVSHPVWQPEGHVWKLGNHSCYDPKKDMILPVMFSPGKYASSPFLGGKAPERKYLAVFKGRTQPTNLKYSRSIRQTLQNLTRDEGWWEKHKIWIGEDNPPDVHLSYSELLASSTFCFSLMGDGFSSRFDDAVIHNCIPVMVHDGVEPTWSSILDTSAYSLRIMQKDMPRVPEILKAVPQADIDRMRANLAKVWRRHIWSGYRPYGEMMRNIVRQNAQEQEKKANASDAPAERPAGAVDPATYDPSEDDALSTLIQWLYSRLDDLGAHAPGPERRRARAAARKV